MFNKPVVAKQYRLSPRNRLTGVVPAWESGWSVDEWYTNGRNGFWSSLCVFATRAEAEEAMNFMKEQNK